MTTRKDQPKQKRGLRLGWRLAAAWFAAFWEETWPRLWPALCVAGLWLTLALTDVLPSLNGWLHSALLAIFALAFAAAVFFGFRRYRVPGRQAALRRLEAKNDLDHRPLDAVRDELAVGGGDPAAEAMWKAHQERMRARIRSLKVGVPEVHTARYDRYALRGAVALLLMLGLMVGWSDAGDRVGRAVSPVFGERTMEKVSIEAWLTPPEYTGMAPRMLTGDQLKQVLQAPRGSRLMIQVHGTRHTPVLLTGRQHVEFEALDRLSHQGEVEIYDGGRLTITANGSTIVETRIELTPDKVPTVAWAKDPEGTNRASLRLQYTAEDDYRVAFMRAYIARDGERKLVKLDLPITGGKKAKGTSFHDLTAHPWAGMDVSIIIEAEDDAGQRGKSAIKNAQMPQRVFQHPIAREIITQRRLLYLNPEDMPVITARIGYLASRPESYGNDRLAYLTLRVAQARIFRALKDDGRSDAQLIADKNEAVNDVMPLLWEAALRIEEGSLSRAERELRRLQRELSEKLSRKDTDPKELKRLMDQLEKALREYMKALREDMRKNPQKYAQNPMNRDMQNMTPRDLSQMMEEMRRMLQNNERQNLQQRLAELRQMLENLKRGQAQRMDPNHPALKAMRELGDIIRRQQKLNDQTFRRSQQQRDGQKTDPKEAQRQQQEQENLRKQLSELMKKLNGMTGKTPQNLDRAQREMQRAEGQLKQNQPGNAIGPQKRALDQLRKGAGQAMRQLAQRFGMGRQGIRGFASRPGTVRQGRDQDPLGRRMDGMGRLNTDDVKVPTESEKKRARDILEELRRRSGEADRPKIERDYIDRLLRQF